MAALEKHEIDFSTEVIPQFMGRISTYINSSYHRDIGTVISWNEAHKDFPPFPASEINAKSWAETLKSSNSSLQTIMTQLL
jgi:mannose-1-phosphate guanylyltransferase